MLLNFSWSSPGSDIIGRKLAYTGTTGRPVYVRVRKSYATMRSSAGNSAAPYISPISAAEPAALAGKLDDNPPVRRF